MKFYLLFIFLLFTSLNFSRTVNLDSNVSDFNLSGTRVYVYVGNVYQTIFGTFDTNGLLSLEVPDGDVRYRIDFGGKHYIEATSASSILVDMNSFGFRDVLVDGSANKEFLVNNRVYVFNELGAYQSANSKFDENGFANLFLPPNNFKYRIDAGGQHFTPVTSSTTITVNLNDFGFRNVVIDASLHGSFLKNARVYAFNSENRYQRAFGIFDDNSQASLFLPPDTFKYRIDIGGQHFTSLTNSTNVVVDLNSFGFRDVLIDGSLNKEVLKNIRTYAFNAENRYQRVNSKFDENGHASLFLPPQGFKYRIDIGGQHFTPVTSSSTIIINLDNFGFRNVVIDGSINKEHLKNNRVFAFDNNNKYLRVNSRFDENGQATLFLPTNNFKYRIDAGGQHFTPLTSSSVVAIDLNDFGFREVIIDGSLNKLFLRNQRVYAFNEIGIYQKASGRFDLNGFARLFLPPDIFKYRIDYGGQHFTPATNQTLLTFNLNDFGFRNVLIDASANKEFLLNQVVYAYDDEDKYQRAWGKFDVNGHANLFLPNNAFKFRYGGANFTQTTSSTNIVVDFTTLGYRNVLIDGSLNKDFIQNQRAYAFNSDDVYQGVWSLFNTDGFASLFLPNQAFKYNYGGVNFTPVTSSTLITINLNDFGFRDVLIDGSINKDLLINARVYAFNEEGRYQRAYGRFDVNGHAKIFLPINTFKYRIDYGGQHFTQATTSTTVVINLDNFGFRNVLIDGSANKELLVNNRVYTFDEYGRYQRAWTKFDENGHANLFLPNQEFTYRINYGGEHFTPLTNNTIVIVNLNDFNFRNVLIDGSLNKDRLVNTRVYAFNEDGRYQRAYSKFDANGHATLFLPPQVFKYRVDYGGKHFTQATVATTVVVNLSNFGFRDVIIDASLHGGMLKNARAYAFNAEGRYQSAFGIFDDDSKATLFLPADTFKYRIDFGGQHFTNLTNSANVVVDLNTFGFRDVVVDSNIDGENLSGFKVYVFNQDNRYQRAWSSFGVDGLANLFLPPQEFKYRVDYLGQHFSGLTDSAYIFFNKNDFTFSFALPANPIVSFLPNQLSLDTVGITTSFKVVLDKPALKDSSLTLSSIATDDHLYFSFSPQTVLFPKDSLEAEVQLNFLDDSFEGFQKTAILTASSLVNLDPSTGLAFFLFLNKEIPTITYVDFDIENINTLEGQKENIVLNLSQVLNEDVEVYFEVIESNASVDDLEFSSHQNKELFRIIKAGDLTTILPLKTILDNVIEGNGNEILTIRIVQVNNAQIGTKNILTLNILDQVLDPLLPSVEINQSSDIAQVLSQSTNNHSLLVTALSNGGTGTLKIRKYLSLDNGLTWQQEGGDVFVSNNVEKSINFSLNQIPYSDALKFKVEVILNNNGVITKGSSKVTKNRFEYYPLSFKSLNPTPKPLKIDHSSSVYKGKIYYFGGSTNIYGNEYSDSRFLSYDPRTKIWGKLLSAPEARRKHNSFISNDKLYVYGGINRLNEYQSSFLIYDFIEKTWSKVLTTGPKIAEFAITSINSSAFIWGGRDKNQVNNREFFGYNIESNQFISFGVFESGLEQLNQLSDPRVQKFCITQDKMFLISGKSRTSLSGGITHGQISYASMDFNNIGVVSDFTIKTFITNSGSSSRKFSFFCEDENLYISAMGSTGFINKINLLEDNPQVTQVTKHIRNEFSHSINKIKNEIIVVYPSNNPISTFHSYDGNPYYERDSQKYTITNKTVTRVNEFLHFEYDINSSSNIDLKASYSLKYTNFLEKLIFDQKFENNLFVSTQSGVFSTHVLHKIRWSQLLVGTQNSILFKAYLDDKAGNTEVVSFNYNNFLSSLLTKRLKPTLRRSHYAKTNNDTSLFIWGGEFGDGNSPNEKLISFESYSFLENKWTHLNEYYTEFTNFASISADDNFVYITGGASQNEVSNQFLKYDINLGTFTDLGGLPFIKFNHQSIIYDNKLYIIGGSNSVYLGKPNNSINRIDIYDLVNNRWSDSINDIVLDVSNVELINDELYLLGKNDKNVSLIQKINLLTKEKTLLTNSFRPHNLFGIGRLKNFLVVSLKYNDDLQFFDTIKKQWTFDNLDLLREDVKIENLFSISDSLYVLGYYNFFNEMNLYKVDIDLKNQIKLSSSSNRIIANFDLESNISNIEIRASEDRGQTYTSIDSSNIVTTENTFTYLFPDSNNRLLEVIVTTENGNIFTKYYDFKNYNKNTDYCPSLISIFPANNSTISNYHTDLTINLDTPIKTFKVFHYLTNSIESEKVYIVTTDIAKSVFTIFNIALGETNKTPNNFILIPQEGCEIQHTINVENTQFNPNFQVISVENKIMHRINNPYQFKSNYPTITFKTDNPIKLKIKKIIYPLVTRGEHWQVVHTPHYSKNPVMKFNRPNTYSFTITKGLLEDNIYLPFGDFYVDVEISSFLTGVAPIIKRLKLNSTNINFEMIH